MHVGTSVNISSGSVIGDGEMAITLVDWILHCFAGVDNQYWNEKTESTLVGDFAPWLIPSLNPLFIILLVLHGISVSILLHHSPITGICLDGPYCKYHVQVLVIKYVNMAIQCLDCAWFNWLINHWQLFVFHMECRQSLLKHTCYLLEIMQYFLLINAME